jgi:hypothetical protein
MPGYNHPLSCTCGWCSKGSGSGYSRGSQGCLFPVFQIGIIILILLHLTPSVTPSRQIVPLPAAKRAKMSDKGARTVPHVKVLVDKSPQDDVSREENEAYDLFQDGDATTAVGHPAGTNQSREAVPGSQNGSEDGTKAGAGIPPPSVVNPHDESGIQDTAELEKAPIPDHQDGLSLMPPPGLDVAGERQFYADYLKYHYGRSAEPQWTADDIRKVIDELRSKTI